VGGWRPEGKRDRGTDTKDARGSGSAEISVPRFGTPDPRRNDAPAFCLAISIPAWTMRSAFQPMKPLLKLHLGSFLYCAILVSLNWWSTTEYVRRTVGGVTHESVHMVTLGLLLSAGVALYLACHCLGSFANLLLEGRRLSPGKWLPSKSVVLYALPLLWTKNITSSWIDADGAAVTQTGGYGHPSSSTVFVLAIAGMLLFQILMRLKSGGDDSRDAFGADARLRRA
jgi:hypothetical protein